MSIKTVGIIGAGTMGNGIAQACAVVGIDAVMLDINEAAVQKGVAAVSGSLDRLVKKEKMTAEQKAAAMARIKPTTQMADMKGVDIVIEAATENLGLKLKILKDIEAAIGADTIIASNTSSISITQLAAATGAPGPVHRHALLQSGALDGAGRTDSRPADHATRRTPRSRPWPRHWARRRSR